VQDLVELLLSQGSVAGELQLTKVRRVIHRDSRRAEFHFNP